MRHVSISIAIMLMCAPPALAGITVASYSTTAGVNAWAPVGGTDYIEIESLENISPAAADASADWTGTNVGGSTTTWRFVGTAQATSNTTFDSNSLTVTGAGSFAYDITATADFINPSSASIFSPGAGANYEGFFNTDVPLTYSISGQLNLRGRVRLNSLSGLVVFDQRNSTSTPLVVNFAGTISPGDYQVRFTTGLGAPNLPNGVNHFEASGSYENVTFTVQVPESNHFGIWTVTIVIAGARRTRCASVN
jgi:hypothetical protein